jgi:hypothetical protein
MRLQFAFKSPSRRKEPQVRKNDRARHLVEAAARASFSGSLFTRLGQLRTWSPYHWPSRRQAPPVQLH